MYYTCVFVDLHYSHWRFYHRVPRRQLPIYFFTCFCCRMYHSARTHSENRTAEIFGHSCRHWGV